jgi:four helix bundle protein
MTKQAKKNVKKTVKSTIVSKPASKEVAKNLTERPVKKPMVKSFRDLGTWQLAQELAVAVYRQCELFPVPAGSVLSCQMTQAAVSACSNIAESFIVRGEARDKLFNSALASLTRLDSYNSIGLELGFLSRGQAADLDRRCGLTRWTLLKLQNINREWMKK